MTPISFQEVCLTVIKDDPWLLFGGVIAITNTNSEKTVLEKTKGT